MILTFKEQKTTKSE